MWNIINHSSPIHTNITEISTYKRKQFYSLKPHDSLDKSTWNQDIFRQMSDGSQDSMSHILNFVGHHLLNDVKLNRNIVRILITSITWVHHKVNLHVLYVKKCMMNPLMKNSMISQPYLVGLLIVSYLTKLLEVLWDISIYLNQKY